MAEQLQLANFQNAFQEAVKQFVELVNVRWINFSRLSEKTAGWSCHVIESG